MFYNISFEARPYIKFGFNFMIYHLQITGFWRYKGGWYHPGPTTEDLEQLVFRKKKDEATKTEKVQLDNREKTVVMDYKERNGNKWLKSNQRKQDRIKIFD